MSDVKANDLRPFEDRYRELLNVLLCYVNGVTAWHRHGNKIPKIKLDNLSNIQIEIEEDLRQIEKDKEIVHPKG